MILGAIKVRSFKDGTTTSYENLGYFSGNLLSDNSEQVASDAALLNTFGQAVIDLTNQTYVDTTVDYTVSINDIINS